MPLPRVPGDELLGRVPGLPADNSGLLALRDNDLILWLGEAFSDDFPALHHLSGFMLIKYDHPDVVLISQHDPDRILNPLFPARRRHAHLIDPLSYTVGG